MLSTRWHKKYLNLATHIADWSKDPSTKVGAIAVGNVGQILATGYNGLPRGIEDSEERLSNREHKYRLTVHAEMNCIYNATYNGVSLKNSTLYVSGLPVCSDCAKGVIQVGVKTVVMPKYIDVPKKWHDSFKETKALFEEANTDVIYVEV